MSYLQKDEILKLVRRVVAAENTDAFLLESMTLQSRGKGIVDIVLDELFQFKESGALAQKDSFVVYALILAIQPYVETRHAKLLTEILLWDEVSLIRDGSTRHRLLGILKRIGGVEEIIFLEQLSIKVKGIVYQEDQYLDLSASHIQSLEKRDIKNVITAIQVKEGLTGRAINKYTP